MTMTRRATLVALFVLCFGGAAWAQTQADPVAFVQGLYRGYEPGRTPLPLEKQPFSLRMRKLFAADAAYAQGEVGRLDFDPIVNAQDWKLNGLKVTLVSKSDDIGAIVDAAFNDLGSKERIRFTLVRENGKWVIDEIQALQAMRWTLSKILEGAPDAYPDNPAK
jgi:hypothetical protein